MNLTRWISILFTAIFTAGRVKNPYILGIRHSYWGNHTIVPGTVHQPREIWWIDSREISFAHDLFLSYPIVWYCCALEQIFNTIGQLIRMLWRKGIWRNFSLFKMDFRWIFYISKPTPPPHPLQIPVRRNIFTSWNLNYLISTELPLNTL